MIQLERVTKTYRIEGGLKLVLDDIDFVFPSGLSVGVLGMNGAGKSTLLRLLSGADQPTSGRVRRNRRISWPVSLSGFNGSLTGEENVRFFSRLYGHALCCLVYRIRRRPLPAHAHLFSRHAREIIFCFEPGLGLRHVHCR